jgi:hypothetical protein
LIGVGFAALALAFPSLCSEVHDFTQFFPSTLNPEYCVALGSNPEAIAM